MIAKNTSWKEDAEAFAYDYADEDAEEDEDFKDD